MENSTNVVSIEDKLKTIDNATVNDYGTVALNVYQIYPNTIVYPLTGYSGADSETVNQFFGADALLFEWSALNIGILYPRSFNIYTSSGTRAVDIEYVDGNGDYAIRENVQIDTSLTALRLTNAININRISWSDNILNSGIPITTVLRTRDTAMGVYRDCINASLGSGSSIITIPNSYIGMISNVYFSLYDTSDSFIMVVKDKRNNVKASQVIKVGPGASDALDGRYVSLNSLKYPLYPGDSVFFVGIQSAGSITYYRYVHAIVTLTRF